MKNILKLAAALLALILLFTGCESDAENVSDEPITLTVYNNSSHELTSLTIEPDDEDVEVVDALSEPLEPGESVEVTIPGCVSCLIIPEDNGNEWYGESMHEEYWYPNTDDLIIISDELYPYGFLFYGCTVEEGLQELEEILAASEPDSTDETETEMVSLDDTDSMVQALGYDTLADMRFMNNDYINNPFNDSFSELDGYWYPDNDQNSLTYFKIERGTVYWYTFEAGKGDVETSYETITTLAFGTYTTTAGNKLVLKSEGLFSSYIFYNGGDTKYYHADH